MPVPRLSVILPNYNHAEFLPRCIEAFLNQSFLDFELIVVDDASTDNSYDILQAYDRKDSRIRLYRNLENQGVASTLNRALSYCRGEYLHGAASDDYVLPGYFEACLKMFGEHPEAGICLGKTRCVNDKGMVVSVVPGDWAETRVYLTPKELARRMTNCGVPGPSVWRRDAFLKAGGYNPDLRWHCDWFALQVIAFRHGLCFLPEIYTVVRMVENSYSNNQHRAVETQRQVLQTLLRELQHPKYRDVVPLFEKSNILSQFGFGLVAAAATLEGSFEGLVELLKPHILPHAANLMRSPNVAIRHGTARFLGECEQDGLAFDRELAEAARDRYPNVAEAAAESWREIKRSIPKTKLLLHSLRRTIGRILRRIDRYARPLVHDRLERQQQLLNELENRQNEARNDILGTLYVLREQLDHVKQELAVLLPERQPALLVERQHELLAEGQPEASRKAA